MTDEVSSSKVFFTVFIAWSSAKYEALTNYFSQISGPQGDNHIVPDLAAAQTGDLGGILGGVGGRPGLGGPGGLAGTSAGGMLNIFYCRKIKCFKVHHLIPPRYFFLFHIRNS